MVTGILNISNKLLVTLDILFEMREHIKRGEPPGDTANAVILASLDLPSAPKLTPGESRYLIEKLYDGYFAFEVLTEEIGMLLFVEFVVCVLFLKVVMGMPRIVLHFLDK